MTHPIAGSRSGMVWTLLSLAATLAIVVGLVALALLAVSVVVLLAIVLMAAVSGREPRPRNVASSPN
ncbi:hypothetical protein [Nonomuraea sp. NPDC003804]|uniref:hypothetical protein n=1 Tax=Nonomuraea sp. NPDC003804 TaxID=3154547 RepID=UPI0033BA9C2F